MFTDVTGFDAAAVGFCVYVCVDRAYPKIDCEISLSIFANEGFLAPVLFLCTGDDGARRRRARTLASRSKNHFRERNT